MKKYILNFLLTILSVILISACAEQYDDVYTVINDNHSNKNFTIPPDEAVSNLQSFLKTQQAETRSLKIQHIANISALSLNNHKTRTELENAIVDTLIYVINFENDNGYAIVSADRRIKENIIAVVDSGNLSNETVSSSLGLVTNNRRIFHQYPLNGDGIYNLPQTGNKLYINPNTVSLKDSITQDTYIGNFIPMSEGIVEKLDTIVMEGKPMGRIPQNITTALCVQYAIESINNNLNGDSNETFSYVILDENGFPSNKTPLPNKEYRKNYEIIYNTVEEVQPLLKPFALWHQHSPFNDLYPIVHNWKLTQTKKAYAGCFPLAMAKLQTYFRCVLGKYGNGQRIDYEYLYYNGYNESKNQNAANLLFRIADECHCIFFYEGTFTLPYFIKEYMRSLKFSNVYDCKYNFADTKTMLDNGKPIMVYCVPDQTDLTQSHAWNIDGYKIVKEDTKTNWYNENILAFSTIQTKEYDLVHCDFGWKGSANGYYLSGIFVTNAYNTKLDSNIHHNSSAYADYNTYTDCIRQIMYNTSNTYHTIRE